MECPRPCLSKDWVQVYWVQTWVHNWVQAWVHKTVQASYLLGYFPGNLQASYLLRYFPGNLTLFHTNLHLFCLSKKDHSS